MEEQASGAGEHHQPDFDERESKSPLSQESGLCSTMLVTEDSMGSLDELSESVHQQLDSHIDQAAVLLYEVDLLKTQLAQKNRVITTQQVTIKQLQEALAASHKEITCKNETINMLQSDLVDCQQQYAECFQQFVQQDRVLTEIRDDDAVLIQKIAFLEKQLRTKASRTISTQTEGAVAHSSPLKMERTSSQEFLTPHSQLRFASGGCVPRSSDPRRSLYFDTPNVSAVHCPSPQPFPLSHTPSPSKTRPVADDSTQEPASPVQQLKEIMAEIREIQASVNPSASQQTSKGSFRQRSPFNSSEVLEDFWNAIAEERQQRIKLDHVVRQMELDLLEVKNQVQSCKARIASQKDASAIACQRSSKTCCQLMEEAIVPAPSSRSLSNSAAAFYTLV